MKEQKHYIMVLSYLKQYKHAIIAWPKEDKALSVAVSFLKENNCVKCSAVPAFHFTFSELGRGLLNQIKIKTDPQFISFF